MTTKIQATEASIPTHFRRTIGQKFSDLLIHGCGLSGPAGIALTVMGNFPAAAGCGVVYYLAYTAHHAQQATYQLTALLGAKITELGTQVEKMEALKEKFESLEKDLSYSSKTFEAQNKIHEKALATLGIETTDLKTEVANLKKQNEVQKQQIKLQVAANEAYDKANKAHMALLNHFQMNAAQYSNNQKEFLKSLDSRIKPLEQTFKKGIKDLQEIFNKAKALKKDTETTLKLKKGQNAARKPSIATHSKQKSTRAKKH